jgi:hypothetical protein
MGKAPSFSVPGLWEDILLDQGTPYYRVVFKNSISLIHCRSVTSQPSEILHACVPFWTPYSQETSPRIGRGRYHRHSSRFQQLRLALERKRERRSERAPTLSPCVCQSCWINERYGVRMDLSRTTCRERQLPVSSSSARSRALLHSENAVSQASTSG